MSVLCPQNVRALSKEHPCSVRRMSVLCPKNGCALSKQRPRSVQRTTVLCPKNVSTLFTECSCSVHASATKKTILPNLLIVVAERNSPNDSQDACPSNSRHLICRSFSVIPWTLHEVSRLFVKRLWTLPRLLCFAVRESTDCLYGNSVEKSKLPNDDTSKAPLML